MYNLINIKQDGSLVIDHLYTLDECRQVIGYLYSVHAIRYTRISDTFGNVILTINAKNLVSDNLFTRIC